MKRSGILMPQVYDFIALHRAWRKAMKGSGKTPESMAFTFHLEAELLSLSKALRSGTYKPSPYRYFRIYDPKERTISVASFRDRVVHHAVVAVLEPIYERSFIYDSYATRPCKGTHKALARTQRFLKKNYWYFKTDIEKYFDSISHQKLLAILERKIKDQSLLDLMARIIDNGGKEGQGLPIGNLTSQFFANVYLDPFDHFVKEKLRVRCYLRYMDDFVLFSNNKAELKYYRETVISWLNQELGLQLKTGSSSFNRRIHGLGFLGARVFPSCIRVKRENLKRLVSRMQRKEQEWLKGTCSEEHFITSLNSYCAYLQSFDSHSFRQWLIQNGQLATGVTTV